MHGLKEHQKIHTGVRDYMCFRCEKTFITAEDLKIFFTARPCYRAPVQPALGPLCSRCMTCTNQCFVLFAGSEYSMCNDADIINSSQTELAGCDE